MILRYVFHFCGEIASEIMKIPTKLYLIVFVCATILFVQYHIYSPYTTNDYPYDRKTPGQKPLTKEEEIATNASACETKQTHQSVEHHSETDFGFYFCKLCELIANKVTTDLPPVYIITPTYRRPEQLAELTRMSHTLMLVPNLIWLVIEDAYGTNSLVEDILRRSGIRYHYMIAPMPVQYKNKTKGPRPRGVSNRNKGLNWIRENAYNGVFYFADDDNTYDLDLFSEIRYTKTVSMFPVGLITKAGVSSPIVRNGTFRGFYDGWIGGRKFALDMAGFAVSVQFLLSRPQASMPYKPGFEEDGFLKSLAPFEPFEAELLASNCTRILVWHTQTKKNEPAWPLDYTKYNNTNLIALKNTLV